MVSRVRQFGLRGPGSGVKGYGSCFTIQGFQVQGLGDLGRSVRGLEGIPAMLDVWRFCIVTMSS